VAPIAGLSQGGNLAERSPLDTVAGPLANTQKQNLRNDGESGWGWLYWNPKSPENYPLKAQKNNLLKTKRILKPKYKPSEGRVFTLSLLGGGDSPLCPPVNYGTAYNPDSSHRKLHLGSWDHYTDETFVLHFLKGNILVWNFVLVGLCWKRDAHGMERAIDLRGLLQPDWTRISLHNDLSGHGLRLFCLQRILEKAKISRTRFEKQQYTFLCNGVSQHIWAKNCKEIVFINELYGNTTFSEGTYVCCMDCTIVGLLVNWQ